jgi:hypothetical protein
METLICKSDSKNEKEHASRNNRRLQLKYRNFDAFTHKHGISIVQYPFTGAFKEMEVMNNPTLFHKTRGNSLNDSKMKTVDARRTYTGSGSRQALMSQYSDHKQPSQMVKILDSSFGSSFPFFSTSNANYDAYRGEYRDTGNSERAKTPALMTQESEPFDREGNLSPKSILKKPNTAHAGSRKRVHYNLQMKFKRNPSSHEVNNPQIADILQSSYFKK